MTTRSHSHTITSSELAGRLGTVLDAVGRGTTYTVTRHGRPIAVIEPLGAGASAPSDVPVAQDEPAAYGAATMTAFASPDTALTRLFGGKAIRSVMAAFVREPNARYYQRQIARTADIGLRSAQLALDRLEGLGLIESERDGNRRYYQAVRSDRFEELRALLSRELGIAEVIARHLRALAQPVSWAFVFGSAASGEDKVGSDIDLLVVSEASDDDLVGPLADAERELGREIDVVSYRPDEFESKRAEGNHFIATVLAKPRLDVIGGRGDA